jgi:hypothetical protein
MSERKGLGKTSIVLMVLAVLAVATIKTGVAHAAGPTPVNLRTAGNFRILAKTGISTTGTTSITGDME